MSMESRSSLPWFAIVAVVLLLVGCQHNAPADVTDALESWRVLERVGDVRALEESGMASRPLRPGDTISGNSQITTDKGALVIMARGGVQLTAGENSSLTLPASKGPTSLVVERGWLRTRIANGVDRELRIKTPKFDISAANTTLTLTTADNGTELSIESGTAVLATIDGRHHATLVAGAGAKMNSGSNDDLLIRPASGQLFAKVTPFQTPADRQDDDGSRPTSEPTSEKAAPKLSSAANHEPTTRPAKAEPAAATGMARDDVMIRPASRLRRPGSFEQAPPAGAKPTSPPIVPVVHQARGGRTSPLESPVEAMSQPSASDVRERPIPAGRVREPAASTDAVQLKFDRLTDGLLESL